ncbi:PLP-dependent aminotransferase family protein [Paenibacillus terrigena]|uniref:MocR-like pyridoxine biosynthesis transcription factor PdxR n=1 Tax=Paenibacillus terrigena TaxID=369333 RepID=UPI000378A6B0|nr:PLP-dependent aminotransferase family protein [Paenibacillus terrigena]
MDFGVPFASYLQEYRYKYLALFHALRAAILAGTIPHGAKLPSTREMSDLYQLSRGSVNQVYDMLLAEGYVTAAIGSGTYVTYELQEPQGTDPESSQHIALSAWGRRATQGMPLPRENWPESLKQPYISLEMGKMVVDAFPTDAWNHVLYQEIRQLESARMDTEHPDTLGHVPLREAIALHLRRMRGIQADAKQVVIFNGSMHAIALLTQLLIDPGDRVIVENPGYMGMKRAIEAAGGIVKPNAVDEQGILVQDWEEKLVFVTPSRQFPTGAVLSLERRQQLLAWAARRNGVIIEDDYDSEIRYGGRPIEPLKSLDLEGRVVYVGTFSKTMYTGLRIGYAVLPMCLVEPMRRAKEIYEPSPISMIEQRALAAFIQNGHYERHLRRMRRIYSRKYAFFYRMMQEHVGHLFNVLPCDAGMHVYASWKGTAKDYEAFRCSAAAHGVGWTDGGRYLYLPSTRNAACFGFAHLQEEELLQGILRMKTAWEDRHTHTKKQSNEDL